MAAHPANLPVGRSEFSLTEDMRDNVPFIECCLAFSRVEHKTAQFNCANEWRAVSDEYCASEWYPLEQHMRKLFPDYHAAKDVVDERWEVCLRWEAALSAAKMREAEAEGSP